MALLQKTGLQFPRIEYSAYGFCNVFESISLASNILPSNSEPEDNADCAVFAASGTLPVGLKLGSWRKGQDAADVAWARSSVTTPGSICGG